MRLRRRNDAASLFFFPPSVARCQIEHLSRHTEGHEYYSVVFPCRRQKEIVGLERRSWEDIRIEWMEEIERMGGGETSENFHPTLHFHFFSHYVFLE
ncbi:uncharacterized protein BP01DRAFT_90645 [Aspergillus saccharolyticus JOP 1030-1]|uniref:Uncharacterized protein n=1 Tax=Aspergillus saccharolyticus JOP 1030-1 TaxID=1450539 RepID=A0A318ZH79_9EURO|nr:hypothetical protein BP01DRAFT_90645 [Aspergillus saccharolyticus JOP 1030-1]PYH43933.1 hypothetical protein BP01DRAFT_90645 [Aspergillus saccharolyticus JOP 1030-1]